MTNAEAIETLRANYPDACYEQLREAVDKAIKALEAQEAKAQLSAEGTTSDLISRQAAIDAILAVTGNSSVRELYEHVQEHGLSDMWSGGVNAAIDIIIAVPPAQSEKLTTAEKSQLAEEKSTRKLIYLDDAIRIVESFYKVNADIRRIMAFELRQLPSAQPEWNNHTVACMLAELFDDTCACNYNGIDEWLPEKCEVIDACPNPAGVACWEQFLKHRAERRTDEGVD